MWNIIDIAFILWNWEVIVNKIVKYKGERYKYAK